MEKVLKKQIDVDKHGKFQEVEQEERIDASTNHHEDRREVRVIFVVEGSKEETSEDLFWDKLESSCSSIDIKPSSP